MNVLLKYTKPTTEQWEKFIDGTNESRSEEKNSEKKKSEENKKQNIFAEMIRDFRKCWSQSNKSGWYGQVFNTYYRAVLSSESSYYLDVRTLTPLWIGNGVATVMESYVTLHRIYGVPYIPGTAIKGVVAHYCHHMIGVGSGEKEFEREGDIFKNLFGTIDQKGYITFHDALPYPESVVNSLTYDVMTPHHPDYNLIAIRDEQKDNQNKNSNNHMPAPRDDDTPVPHMFLTVNKDTCFRLMLTCEGKDEESKKWLMLAKELVKKALAFEGIGGKTNAGFGRLEVLETK